MRLKVVRNSRCRARAYLAKLFSYLVRSFPLLSCALTLAKKVENKTQFKAVLLTALSRFSLISFLSWPAISLYNHIYAYLPFYMWMGRVPIYAAANLLLWTVFRLLLRSRIKADLALLGYTLVVLALTPLLPDALWRDYPYNLLMGLIVWPLIYLLRLRSPKITLFLNLMLIAFLLTSAGRAGGRLLYKRVVLQSLSPPACPPPTPKAEQQRPDIYLIILDACGAPSLVQKVTGLSLALPTALQELGASLSEEIRNPSRATFSCMNSFLSLSNNPVSFTHIIQRKAYDTLAYAKLTPALSNLGYYIRSSSPEYHLLFHIPCVSWDLSYTWNIFDHSFPLRTNWRKWLHNRFYLSAIQKILGSKQDERPDMTYIHLMGCHEPYVLDRSGAYNVSYSKRDRLVQGFLYTDSVALALIRHIQNLHSVGTRRDYVLLVFSDHGPRTWREHDIRIEDSNAATEITTRCFAAILSSRAIPTRVDSAFKSCRDHACLGQVLLDWVQHWPVGNRTEQIR